MDLLTSAPLELHPDTTTMAVFRYALGSGECFGAHTHPQHQLSWSPSGTLTAETPGRHWQLLRTSALWIPADLPHDVGASRPAELVNVRFNAAFCPFLDDEPVVVDATPLLVALIERLADPEMDEERRARAEQVLLDELAPVAGSPMSMSMSMSVPMPFDGRALAVARALLADPADGRALSAWGREVGASERTLVRFFSTETGLSFSAWRSRVRLRAALGHLDAGATTSSAAARVGYRNVGAFIDAFQRVTGITPGAYRTVSARRT